MRPRLAGFLLRFHTVSGDIASAPCRALFAPLLTLLVFGSAPGAAAQTSYQVSIGAPADANEDNSGTRNLDFTVSQPPSAVSETIYFQVCTSGSAKQRTNLFNPSCGSGPPREGAKGPTPSGTLENSPPVRSCSVPFLQRSSLSEGGGGLLWSRTVVVPTHAPSPSEQEGEP